MNVNQLNKETSTFYLWPIITLIPLFIFKRILLGFPNFYYDLFTDIFLVVLVIILAKKRTIRWVQIIQFIIAGVMVFYHWLDACIIMSVHQRFTYDNIVANVGDLSEIKYFINAKLIAFTLIILLLLFLPQIIKKKTITLAIKTSSSNFISYELLFVLFLITLFLYQRQSPTGQALNLYTRSFTANSVTSETESYINSNFSQLIQRILSFFNGDAWTQPIAADVQHPDIIFVLSESLSSVDSKYAGGLFNRLPKIDALAQNGIILQNMVASGKISNAGLGAILMGVQPNRTGGFLSIEQQFPPGKFPQNDIVAYAKRAGYKLIVIDGTQTQWQNLSQWFKDIGFDQVFDGDSPEFANVPKFTWNAPSDEAMYALTEKLMAQQKNGPYFILIETMSLHQPYILPADKYRITDSALVNQVHYVDESTSNFYNQLKQQGFFNNGILVIVGDHRRFEPLEKAEIDDGGYAVWHERIVGCVVGKNVTPHTISTTPFTQVDMNTLLHLIIQGEPVVDAKTIVQANLASRLGIDTPFSIALGQENIGGYLIRSEKYPPMYISIYGKVQFDKIPNDVYKAATVYLIKNEERISSALNF